MRPPGSSYLDLLRLLARWDDLLAEEPADEEAHLALARARVDAGDPRGGLLQLERLEQALRAGSSVRRPGPRRCGCASSSSGARPPRGRRSPRRPTDALRPSGSSGGGTSGDRVRAVLDDAGAGRGVTLLVSGPAGVGKSAVLDLAEALARRQAWKVARAAASSVEGPWPYSPVLEALSATVPTTPRPPRRAGRRPPHRDRARADRTRPRLDRGEQPPTAVRRRRGADEGRGRRPRAAPRGRRRAGRRRGLAAPAALLVPLCRRRAGRPAARAPRPGSVPRPRRHREHRLPRRRCTCSSSAPCRLRASQRLLLDRFPELDPEAADEIAEAAGGLPFAMIEMARARVDGSGPMAAVLPPPRVADLPAGRPARADVQHRRAPRPQPTARRTRPTTSSSWRCAALVVEPAEGGYRFRHPLVREGAGGPAPAARAVAWAPARCRGAGGAGAPARPGGPPLPGRGARVPRGALRGAGGGDRRGARRLPRRAGPGRRRPWARRPRPPAGAAVATGRPAHGAG